MTYKRGISPNSKGITFIKMCTKIYTFYCMKNIAQEKI